MREIKQRTVNLIIVIAAVVVAAGAWAGPLLVAQTTHNLVAANLDILQDALEGEVNEIDSALFGKGLSGGYDLLTLMLAGVEDQELAKFGDFEEFRDFRPPPIVETEVGELIFLQPASNITTIPGSSPPANLDVFSIVDLNAAGNTCSGEGTALDLNGGATGTSLNETLSLVGFAVGAPDVGAGSKFRLLICDPDENIIIVNELFDSVGGVLITKNFDFGTLLNGTDLNAAVIDSDTSQQSGSSGYNVTLHMARPTIDLIPVLPPGVSFCSLQVTVKNDTDGSAVENANVEIGHEFIPFFDFNNTDSSGLATFEELPEGPYFVDVFKTGFFPGFEDIQFCSGPSNAVPDIRLLDLEIGLPTSTLTVNVVDSAGAALDPTEGLQATGPTGSQTALFIEIFAESLPIFFCAMDGSDQSASNHFAFEPDCIEDTTDGDPASAQDAADGQVIFKDIPEGRWFIDAFFEGGTSPAPCDGFGDVILGSTAASVTITCEATTFG